MNRRLPAVAVFCLLLFSLVVPHRVVGAEANVKAVISNDLVRIKERPDIDSESVIGIPKGESVLVVLCLKEADTILGAKGHWGLGRYRGVEGWVFDTVLNTRDPKAETAYKDVPSLSEQIGMLDQLRESGKLAETEAQCLLVIDQIEKNFSKKEITDSARLSGAILGTFSNRIEALMYLHRFDEARAAYAYLMKTYPGIHLEDNLTTAKDLLHPYLVFMDAYPSAPLFTAPGEPMKKIKTALEKKDLSLLSKAALPGVFEIWVAHTDWVVQLGERQLDRQGWLAGSWAGPWKITETSATIDDAGNIVGYCVVTEPWSLNYYEITVNRVDFCVDRLPDGKYAFSYMILYTTPIQ